MVDQPEDRMNSGEEVNLHRFNESFYMSSPADYLTTRLHLLLLAPVGHDESPSTSITAWTNGSGASWGRLCPTPPGMVRWVYFPVNFAA